MRRAAAIDDNQNDLVEFFRRLGWSVQILSAVGEGCTDLAVAKWGLNVMVEIKDGAKSPSKRVLTPDQVEWHRDWRGLKAIVESREHVLEIDQKARAFTTALRDHGLTLMLAIGREQ